MNVGVIVLTPSSESLSRVKAVLKVANVLPGLDTSEFSVLESGIISQLMNPVYAAVATPKALGELSAEAAALSKNYDRVIFIKGENEPGIVEHSLLHELGHVSYQSLYPEKMARRQEFYSRLREAMRKSSMIGYVMGKVSSFVESNPKARVLLTMESDEMYANRFAYTHNTDKSAYSVLARRELQIALKFWEKRSAAQDFDAAFHLVLVDLYMRIINEPWQETVPYTYKWLIPYTTSIVDAVDFEDPVRLFSRQLLLFNAVNHWMNLSEKDVLDAVNGQLVVS